MPRPNTSRTKPAGRRRRGRDARLPSKSGCRRLGTHRRPEGSHKAKAPPSTRSATVGGIEELVLETGNQHPSAWAIYEKAGFTRCGPVLDYPDSEYSIFYHKQLSA